MEEEAYAQAKAQKEEDACKVQVDLDSSPKISSFRDGKSSCGLGLVRRHQRGFAFAEKILSFDTIGSNMFKNDRDFSQNKSHVHFSNSQNGLY